MSNIVMYNSESATASLVHVSTTENRTLCSVFLSNVRCTTCSKFQTSLVGLSEITCPSSSTECSRRSYAFPPYQRASVKRKLSRSGRSLWRLEGHQVVSDRGESHRRGVVQVDVSRGLAPMVAGVGINTWKSVASTARKPCATDVCTAVCPIRHTIMAEFRRYRCTRHRSVRQASVRTT